eukprot:6487137-Amphidinium_carterae.1
MPCQVNETGGISSRKARLVTCQMSEQASKEASKHNVEEWQATSAQVTTSATTMAKIPLCQANKRARTSM